MAVEFGWSVVGSFHEKQNAMLSPEVEEIVAQDRSRGSERYAMLSSKVEEAGALTRAGMMITPFSPHDPCLVLFRLR